MDRLRVLMTTAWYPNRKVAGDGVFIQKHAMAISLSNDVVVLMVQTDKNVKGINIDVEERCNGSVSEILVYVPRIEREIPIITEIIRLVWYLAGTYKGYRRVKAIWNGQQPDVCHVNVLARAGVLPVLLKKIHRIPYIVTEHWSRYGTGAFPSNKIHLWLTRRIVKCASFVSPVSDNLKANMLKWCLDNSNYCLVGNVVDTELFSAKTLRSGGKIRFIHVSWMRDEAKNISGILRVVARLAQKRDDFEVFFVGEGVDRDCLYDVASDLGLVSDGYVSFVGSRQGKALVEELQGSDCMLMFSNYENQPVSILEALSCGLPVIATRVGAIAQMLDDHRGILVDPKDEDGLYSSMDSFIETHVSYSSADMMRRRHDYVVKNHSPEVISMSFDALYRKSLKHL